MIMKETDTCSTGVLSDKLTDAHKLVIHLLLWLTEATKSETDFERILGGALREFFTDELWDTTKSVQVLDSSISDPRLTIRHE